MRGEQLELEFLAAEVRRLAGLTDDDVRPLATTIATTLLGPDGVALDPCLHGPAYLTRREDGGFQIVVRDGLADVRFAIAHELGHYAIREIARARLDSTVEERAANYLAAAILAPAPTMLEAHAHFGEKLRDIARTFGLSQTSTVLRIAEVRGDERAVVTRTGNVLARGVTWATVPIVDYVRGRTQWRGLAKAALRGGIDDGRVAVRVK